MELWSFQASLEAEVRRSIGEEEAVDLHQVVFQAIKLWVVVTGHWSSPHELGEWGSAQEVLHSVQPCRGI